MSRVKLTAGRVRDFTVYAGKPQSFLWDTDAPGLAVRVTANGAKAYIFQGKLDGATIRITIGDVKTWDIEGDTKDAAGNVVKRGAREEARRLQALIDLKIDPRHAKAEQVAEAEAKRAEAARLREAVQADAQRHELKVSSAWDAYLAHQKDKMQRVHIERGKRWGPRHLADHENLAQAGGTKKKRGTGLTKPGVLYPLLQLRMIDVTAESLAEWQKIEAQTRANNARQGFEMFRAFWRWCASKPEYAGVIDPQAVEGKELRDEVPGRKAKEADCLQKEQLVSWFAEVRKLAPVPSAYLQTLLLTGSRREEAAQMQWRDVDFKWSTLRIADKVEGERIIPLTPYVAALLLDLKRRNETPPPRHRILNGKTIESDLDNWAPSPWVFASKTAAGGHIQEPREAHNRALKAAGLPHMSIHGLRRSFGTLAEWVEMPTGVVAQIQGHKPSATAEKHYRRRPIDLLRMWHSTYEAWLLKQAGVEFEQSELGLRAVSAKLITAA